MTMRTDEGPGMTAAELRQRLAASSPPLLLQVLPEAVFAVRRLPGSVNACVYGMVFVDKVRKLALKSGDRSASSMAPARVRWRQWWRARSWPRLVPPVSVFLLATARHGRRRVCHWRVREICRRFPCSMAAIAWTRSKARQPKGCRAAVRAVGRPEATPHGRASCAH